MYETQYSRIKIKLYCPIYSASQRYSARNGLNTSYVSLEHLIRGKFPTGIAQHREHRETQRATRSVCEIGKRGDGDARKAVSLATLSVRIQV